MTSKRIEAIRKAYENPALIARLSGIQRALAADPMECERRRQWMLAHWADPANRARRAAKSAETNARPDVRRKISDGVKAWARQPGSSAIRRAAAIEVSSRVDVRQKKRAASLAAWARPGERERRGAAIAAAKARKRSDAKTRGKRR